MTQLQVQLAVWTPAAGEVITRIELFKNAGLNLENSTKDKYLLVATYSSTGKGKIYVIVFGYFPWSTRCGAGCRVGILTVVFAGFDFIASIIS